MPSAARILHVLRTMPWLSQPVRLSLGTSPVIGFAFLALALLPVAPPGDARSEPPVSLSVRLHEVSVARFTPLAEAAGIIGHDDQFVQSMSPLDRRLRLSANGSVETVEYLSFTRQQALAWTQADVDLLRPALESLANRLKRLPSLYPPVVELIKTTGREEQNAPHCRGNAIVLPEKAVRNEGDSLERLLAHELFHIVSRQSPARRARLYAILGFTACEPISLPAGLASRKITNPDAPSIDCVLQIQEDGSSRLVTPILLARETDYPSLEGKSVFTEMQFRLLAVHRDGERIVVPESSEPTLLDPADCPDFLRQIGRNTGYIIHPEETLADNFVHLLFETPNLPDPWVIERLQEQLSR